MSDRSENVVDLEKNPRNLQGSGSGGGNGNLTRHRLNDLERRMEKLESKVDDLIGLCARIDEKLNEVASKSYVLRILCVTVVVTIGGSLATVIVHAIMRTLVPVS